MKTYIAILRGINVSGQKKIKMADLKSLMEELNFGNVRTYIQSGNVVFECDECPAKELEKSIEEKIAGHYGFQVPTMVKTPDELEYVLHHNPFFNDPDKDPKRFYVTFLDEVPAPELVEKLKGIDYHPEAYVLDGKNIYFFSPAAYGRAKMNNNFFENKLKVAATTRNWNTVMKLVEMAKAKGWTNFI